MTDLNKTPAVDQALVDWLTRVFPDRLPTDPNFEDRRMAYEIGQQSVIRTLRHAAREQSTTVL